MNLCVVVSLMTLGLRCYLRTHAPAHEIFQYLLHWSTYTRCDTLLIGSWLALFLRGRKLSLIQLRQISAILFWVPLPILLVGVRHWHNGGYGAFNLFWGTAGYTLIALVAAGALLRSLDDNSRVSRALRWRPLSGLGVISYGFYFYHALPSNPVHHLVELYPHWNNVIALLWFACSAGIAWLSFRFYETPFLRLKKVLAPHRQSNMKSIAS